MKNYSFSLLRWRVLHTYDGPFVFSLLFIIALGATLYLAAKLADSAPSPPANFLAADKGYGVTIDLTQYDDAALADTLDSLQAHGLTWLRQPIHWAELESASGQLDWQSLDRIFTAVALANEAVPAPTKKFNLIAMLHTTPRWARAPHKTATAPPARLADFGQFVRTFAIRYGQQIDHYQIWHEPNLSENWGKSFVEPAAYANLLREAALNIRAADPQAVIILAALAPTLENGPLNLDEMDYLDQLYRAKADRWFDVVAAQPYGFDSEPTDPARSNTLNFKRVELLRDVMIDHHDAATPIWATAFGWNALPTDWSGPKSPWKSDTPTAQAQRTAGGIEVARHIWPWLGPMLAVRWDAAGLATDDPARGFALLDTPPVLTALHTFATADALATPGRYSATHPSGRYSPGWRFALAQADSPPNSPATLTIPFQGTRLDLNIERGPYRGYLWVTIDSQPANALPRNGINRGYVVLYDPRRHGESITLAKNLTPGHHVAIIQADGGWGQWAVGGWTVYNRADRHPLKIALGIAGLLAAVSGLGLLWSVRQNSAITVRHLFKWWQKLTTVSASVGESTQIIITFTLGAGFYLAPDGLKLALLFPLSLAFLLRPDLGLALIAFGLSFISNPASLPIINLTPLELALLSIAVGTILKNLLDLNHQSPITNEVPFGYYQLLVALKSTDWAALSLLMLALLATLFAPNFGVSMFQWRTLVLPSVVFYFLVRLGLDYRATSPGQSSEGVTGYPSSIANRQSPNLLIPKGHFVSTPQLPTWVWRLSDAFVAGAVLQAILALYVYFSANQYITVEGVRRAVGVVYESPNHLSLFLGRVWPILLAVAALPGTRRLRRGLYAVGWISVSLALILTFSKGALFLGLPVSVGVMLLFYIFFPGRMRYRWRFFATAVSGLVLILLALIPFTETTRLSGSTAFFRLKLWQASLNMLQDHWPLGVGLDNFLYQYRTRYILPEAWQEPDLSHPHNLLLDFGTRLGLGGIVVLLWLQATFWRNTWRLYRQYSGPLILGLMGSMAAFLSHGLVDNAYFLIDLALAFFLVAGLMQRLAEESNY